MCVSPALLRLGAGASHLLPLPGSVLRLPGPVQPEAAPSTLPTPGQSKRQAALGVSSLSEPTCCLPWVKAASSMCDLGAGFVQGAWEPLSPTRTGLWLLAPDAGEPRSPGPQRRLAASRCCASGFPLGHCSASGDFGQGQIGSPAERGESPDLSPSPLPPSLLPSSSPAPTCRTRGHSQCPGSKL